MKIDVGKGLFKKIKTPKSTFEIFILLGVVFIVLLFILPLPGTALDICLGLYTVLAFLAVYKGRVKKQKTSFFPRLLLILTLFGIALFLNGCRIIIIGRLPGFLIRSVTIAAFGIADNAGRVIISAAFLFIVVSCIMVFTLSRELTRISEAVARFVMDLLPAKQIIAEATLHEGTITEGEFKAAKSEEK
jgi:flagellar biosynthesis component FlhA